MSGAVSISREDNPTLWNTVENLAMADGLPMPKVCIINDPAPNAFATGRDPEHASVAATTGLLDLMDKRELNGVMAHEMSHIKNYDIRVSIIVFGLTCAIGYISDIILRVSFYGGGRNDDDDDNRGGGLILGLIGAILAPIVAAFIQLAVSRQREYLADASGALLTRDPDGLASALAKLESNGRPMRRQNNEMAHLYINNPLKDGGISKLFSTHPPIEDRIKRLENMRDKM
jgi:heat shock protein HtpX